jgi:hypothetical protein
MISRGNHAGLLPLNAGLIHAWPMLSPSLRAKRGNPSLGATGRAEEWIASSRCFSQ